MIKRYNKRMTALSMAVGIALLAGCNVKATTQTASSQGGSSEVQLLSTTVEGQVSNIEVAYQAEDYYTDWNIEEVTQITLNGSELSTKGTGVEVEGSTVTITNGGTYVIAGKLNDGQIIVDSQDKEVVRLILNGVEITSSNSSPIYIKNAKKAVISLETGTTNKLSDSTSYVLEEDADEPDATLFSKDDLTINGTGSLIIEANYNHGIASKDELKIMEGAIEVTSVGSGIKGKDMVAIKGGDITIKATKDGIKSTNTTDSSKGFVYIEDGNFNIVAGNDGIQAETDIKVLGGNFNLNTGGGNSNGESHVEELAGKGAGGMTPPKGEGLVRPENEGMIPPEGEGIIRPQNEGMTPPANEGTIKPENEGMTPPMSQGTTKPQNEEVTSSVIQSNETSVNSEGVTEETSDSFKGIKASGRISIDGGNFKIDSADDSIHSNTEIMINDGEFTILSGDDAIHADAVLVINGGKINIDKSYEGLEANEITIAGGNTYVVASDDGVNATDGSSTETIGGPAVNSSSTSKLTISGGYLNVEANGDGIDANGSIHMTGGTVIVNGTVSGGDGALDYDNQFEISGGILVATGSSRMLQSPSSTSTQKTVIMTFTDYQEANSTVALLDEGGEVILSFMPNKKYQSIIISSPLIEEGKTYSLSYGGSVSGTAVDGLYEVGDYSGGTKVTDFTISDSITYLSESGVTTGGNGMGQGRGMRPNDGQGGKRNRGVPSSDTQIDGII